MNPPSGHAGFFATAAAPAGSSLFPTGFISNVTLLKEAAGKLGVSEQTLANALNTTPGCPVNFTAAANQLGVTPKQLMDALGFPEPVSITTENYGIIVGVSNVTVLTNAAEKTAGSNGISLTVAHPYGQ